MEIHRLSSRLAGKHKALQTWGSPLLLALAGLAYSFSSYPQLSFVEIFYGTQLTLGAYLLHKRGQRLEELRYDKDYLYRKQEGQEELIPLTAIHNVELKTFFGGYQIDFYTAVGPGSSLLFLPSALYPLNFRSQDQKIERFKLAIQRAKQAASTSEQPQLANFTA